MIEIKQKRINVVLIFFLTYGIGITKDKVNTVGGKKTKHHFLPHALNPGALAATEWEKNL